MKELTKEDIYHNNVDTINQFKVLQYLKKELNIDEFHIMVWDRDNILVADKEGEELYFHYDEDIKDVVYAEEPFIIFEFKKRKDIDYEI